MVREELKNMNHTTKLAIEILPILAAGWLAGVGCSSSDDNPAAINATGGASAGTTGGSTSANAGSGTGGTSANPTGGTTAGGAGSFVFPDGSCGTTLAGVAIAKGAACTTDDDQICDKTCGPSNVGYKTETCSGAVYAEGDCTFPAGGSYGCFSVPAADATGCPATAPQHNQPCTMEICATQPIGTACGQTTPCAICGVATGYLDSGGAAKTGYCVCIQGSSGGKWACASATAWPCPAGNGCS
jgi:hypothetical protein